MTEENLMDRRELLRLFVAGAIAVSTGGTLAGCGGGGGAAGSLPPGSTPPGAGSGTQTLTGTISTSEIGGSGLMVQSAYQLNAAASAEGAFTTAVSSQGPQLLAVTDSGGALRALGISQPGGKTQVFGASSTAEALVFMTPGILTTDPTEGAQRAAQIQALRSFPPLVAYLAQNLPTSTVPALTQGTLLGTLLQACVQQMAGVLGMVRGRTAGRPHDLASPSSGVTAAYQGASPAAQPILLSNAFYRTVYVVRQNLGSTGVEIPPQAPGFYAAGAVGASWGSLFRGTIGEPGVTEHTDNLTSPPGISLLQFTVDGPGLSSLSTPPPPGVDLSGSTALLRSVVNYVFFPLVDLVGGSSSVLAKTTGDETVVPKIIDEVVNAISVSDPVQELHTAFAEAEKSEAYTAIINVVIGLVGLSLSVLPLLGVILPALLENFAFVLGVGTAALAAANLLNIVTSWFSYPGDSSFTLLVSNEGVIVQ